MRGLEGGSTSPAAGAVISGGQPARGNGMDRLPEGTWWNLAVARLSDSGRWKGPCPQSSRPIPSPRDQGAEPLHWPCQPHGTDQPGLCAAWSGGHSTPHLSHRPHCSPGTNMPSPATRSHPGDRAPGLSPGPSSKQGVRPPPAVGSASARCQEPHPANLRSCAAAPPPGWARGLPRHCPAHRLEQTPYWPSISRTAARVGKTHKAHP